MVGTAIKKYAAEKGMKCAAGVAYGVIDGYLCTLVDGNGTKTLSVSGAVTDEAEQRLRERFVPKQIQKEYRISVMNVERETITFLFGDTVGTMKKIIAFLEILPAALRECGVMGDGFCTACGYTIDEGTPSKIMLINGVAHRIHAGCAEGLDLRAQTEKENYETEEKHLGKGVLGAILGGIVGAIPWAVAYYFGWFFALIGVIIGFAVKFGYEKMGGRPCKAKLAVILIVTLFSVCLGQFLGDAAALGAMILNGEINNAALPDIPNLILYLLQTSAEFRVSVLKNLGLGALFAVLGVFGVLSKTFAEHKGATIKTIELE